MDMIMVDVGENTARIAVGDQAVLFGTGGPDVAEVAEWAGTISYEFLTGISKRVPRLYS